MNVADEQQIFDIGGGIKLFNLSDAELLLPLITKITQKHCQELRPIQHKLSKMLSNDPRRAAIEQGYQDIVARWQSKIELMGAKARGLWCVELDVGDGFLNWLYPELSLAYFRKKDQPLSQRVKLSEYIEEFDPDWAI